MNRKDLQSLSRIRVSEAKALLKLNHYAGAYYLAGYSVECALKSCIAKETQRHDFPDKKRTDKVYTHSAKDLLQVANLKSQLASAMNADARLESNWTVVSSWSEESRYRSVDRSEAEAMIEAVANRNHGVLRWIKQYW
jgi:HEPN domain-containing protein